MPLSSKVLTTFFNLQNEAESNIKIKEVLNNLNLNVNSYMRDSQYTTKDGIVNLTLMKVHIGYFI